MITTTTPTTHTHVLKEGGACVFYYYHIPRQTPVERRAPGPLPLSLLCLPRILYVGILF